MIVVCLAGILRIIMEIYRGTIFVGTLDLFLDLGYGLIFIVTLVALAINTSYRFIYYSFYVPLIVLLCLTLFDRQGLASSTENNIHVALVVIALTMRSTDSLKFSIYLIAGTLVTLGLVEYKFSFFDDFSEYSTSHFNFIFMGIGTIIITYYAKIVFENRKKRLSQIKQELSDNREFLESSQSEIELQTKELKALNAELEIKVNERAAHLKEQREAMAKYLEITSKELQKNYRGVKGLTKKVVKNLDEDTSQMMLQSSENLDSEINALINKLKGEQ